MPVRHTFPRTSRLSGKLAFAAVYAAKIKISRWPLVMYSQPNKLAHPRLGLSVSRAVGIAVRRNRIKRLIREAFRLSQPHQYGLDLIVVVRPHEPKSLVDYQKLLTESITASAAAWAKRRPVE